MPTHVSGTVAKVADAGRRGGRQRRELRRRLGDALRVVGAVAVVGVFVAALTIVIYQRVNLTGPHRAEYEGRIVRKSLTVVETSRGSRHVMRLHVRGQDGVEFDVIVNRGLYERTREGMWIKRGREGINLSW